MRFTLVAASLLTVLIGGFEWGWFASGNPHEPIGLLWNVDWTVNDYGPIVLLWWPVRLLVWAAVALILIAGLRVRKKWPLG